MPELPDVEIFRAYFNQKALHSPIRTFTASTSKILKNCSEKEIKNLLKECEFVKTSRHGKHLFAEISTGFLLCIHFGMTGYFHFYKSKNPFEIHTRWKIDFDKGTLAYVDTRIFGALALTDSIARFINEKNLGPDALEISFEEFKALFKRRGRLKSNLMTQSHLAGIGNIYCDEILFQSQLHPERERNSLSEKEIKTLYHTMRTVLKKAIDAKADVERMPKMWLLPARKSGHSCPRCHRKIKKVRVMNRGTYFCPHCQK